MKYKFTILCIFLMLVGIKVFPQCAGPITYTVSPLPGPGNTYAPGQIVTFCITVDGYNENVSNWFHGLTLNWGPGWDVSTLTVISYPTPANPTTGSSPDSPNVWGYFPNPVIGTATGQSYGGGFYFETGEGNINGTWDGNPGDNYGDECATGTCVWVFCFSIQVSPTAAPGTSVSLSVTPTGDGQSGSWSSGAGACNDPPVPVSTAVVGGTVLVATITGTNITCSGLCNGKASVTAINGSSPYTYKWNTNQTTPAISGLCIGTYTCTVTDAASNTATASYIVTQPLPLAITDSIVNPTCSGSCNGAVITQVTGGTAPYTYTWVGGAAPNSAVDYSICSGMVKLTVTDSNLCVLNDSFTLVPAPPGVVNLVSQTNVACRGESDGSLTVNYTGGSGGTVNYFWSNSFTGATDTALAAGNYTITATDSLGCTASASYTITQPANGINLQNPVITPASCPGVANGAIVANATGGSGALTYAWTEVSNSAHLSGASISSLLSGTYTLTVTDANNCSVSASYVVTAPAAIVIDSLVPHAEPCFGLNTGGASVYIHGGTAPVDYLWTTSTGDTLSSSNSLGYDFLSDVSAGTVSVIITDANHCSAFDTTTITQPTALAISLVNQTNLLCFGGNNGSMMLTASGGTPAYTYAWSNGSNTLNDSMLSAGVYTITLTDTKQCTAVQSYTLTQPTALVSNPGVDNILCFGASNGQVDANPSGGTPPYAFKWSNGDSTQIAGGLAPGAYTGTVADNNGCTVTLSANIIQPAQLNVSFTPSPVKCIGQKNGSVTISLTGGTPPYGYSATRDSVNFIYGSNDSITGLDTGTYILLFSDDNGCTHEASTYIANATPDVFSTTTDSTSCYGPNYTDGSALITVISTQNAPYQYSIDNSLEQDTGYFSNLSAGTHTIIATNVNGCVDTIAVEIYQPARILVSVEPDSITLNLGSGKAVLVSYSNASNPLFNWGPSPGLSCIDCPNPVVTPYTSSDYIVTVSEQKATATCYGTATLSVVVNPFTPVFVPSAFSPNGDGNNDVFKIYGDNISAVSMRVFNRWGELVFETTNSLAGWDGTYKGQLQEPNVFIYEATITFLDNSQVQKNGSFTLVR